MIDFDIDSIKDKPWNKKGESISSYFNYGFTEDTWKVYQLEIKGKSTDSLPPPPVVAPRSGPPPVIQSTGKNLYRGVGLIRTVPIRTIGLIRTVFSGKTFILSILINSTFYRFPTRKFKSNLGR